MHSIPSDLNLNEIIGAEIESIALGSFNVNFSFGDGSIICVQGRIDVAQGDKIISSWDETEGWRNAEFQALFQQKLESFEVVNETLLTLSFTGQLSLRLHNDTPQYEAFQIYLKSGNGIPIVV